MGHACGYGGIRAIECFPHVIDLVADDMRGQPIQPVEQAVIGDHPAAPFLQHADHRDIIDVAQRIEIAIADLDRVGLAASGADLQIDAA